MSAAETWDYGADRATTKFAEMVEDAVFGADTLRDQLGPHCLPELARLLAAIRDAQAKLAVLQRECEANVADAVKASGEREPEVPGVGVLKVRRSSRTEWDSSRLFAVLMARAAEAEDPNAAAFDMLAASLPLTKSLGWRTGGLRECGIDPDQFRATEPTGWRVQVVSA
jgi:hypothetical protein